MNIFESFDQEGMKTNSDTGLESVKLVNYTEIGKFEDSGIFTNQELGNYLRDTLPPSHLENCPSIQYQSESSEKYPHALGTFNCGTHEICIWGPVERFAGAGEILDTVTHEVGHNVHENMLAERPALAEKWSQLNQQSWETFSTDGTGFVSDYARTNVYEDFAESYMTYVRDPEKLLFYNPEKYEFMRNEVFSGTTYSSLIQVGNVLLCEVSN
ncbi:hypothetical protein A0J48_004405 [Sphaerospermopsis aphanizomenoides BCCUSP55]|uniref:putative zinc-binding metallopeptidase n=1 Tax=Sphaerospermopsis aphanizomenoides TaxID=459663 RepID=UPI0019039D00|nr:putative zinc-binding metallopeptidase [Sphaerospermopsis aphanizomenoides]MBK1986791.1 hypothetical protein [Sphaerospermopsis aphanizomenoides BCCUSP55]